MEYTQLSPEEQKELAEAQLKNLERRHLELSMTDFSDKAEKLAQIEESISTARATLEAATKETS